MIEILIGVVVVLFTPCIAWLVSRWADREAAAERERFDRLIQAAQAEDQNLKLLQASKPTRAAGLKSDHRRVG